MKTDRRSSAPRGHRELSPALTLAFLLAALLSGSLVASSAAEPWRPVRPENPELRVRLRSLPTATEQVHQDRTWSRIAVGDTLLFRARGEGELRIDLRPVIEDDSYDGVVRYGIAYDDGGVRRFLRRSQAAGNYAVRSVAAEPGDESRWGLGALDRQVLETPSGLRSFRIFLREEGAPVALVRCLVRGGLERTNPIYLDESDEEDPRQWSWEVRAGAAGYTDNAYLSPKTGPATRDAAFWPLRAEIGMDWEEGLPFELELDYRFEGRFFDDPILDERNHRLSAEQVLDYGPLGRFDDVELSIQQTLRTKDDTFFGRGDIEEFETGSDPATLSLADRFDYRQAELGAELLLEPGADWEWELATEWHRRDYDEDYPAQTEIYALDQHRFRWSTEVRWELRPDTELHLETGLRLRHYDEKFSRRADGTEVVDEPTRLRRWPLSLELRHRPPRGLQLRLELASLVTRDLYEGYWDRRTLLTRAEIGWEFAGGHHLEGGVRWADTDYHTSRVGFDATGPLRRKESLQWSLEGEVLLWPRVSLVFEGEYEDRDNNSPLFAYERIEAVAGLVVRW